MEKTKLGLPVYLMGALTYLLVLFGGFTSGLLVAGYILLCEENIGLKKSAITAILVAVVISAVNLLIGLLPDVTDVFRILFAIFGEYLDIGIVNNIANFFYSIVDLLKTFVFVLLAALELLRKPLKLSVLDKLFN